MAHDNRVVRNVVAGIAAVGTVAGAILAVSGQEGRDVTPDTHQAIYAAAEVLRNMGRDADEITTEVQRRTGADVAADGAVVRDVVRSAVGRTGRHPSTLRTESLVMPVTVAAAADFDGVWGAVYCEPLLPVRQGDTTDLYDACVAQQVGSLGPLLCLADGTPAGHVVRIQATPALAQRAAALVGEVPAEWVACPTVTP